MKKTILSVLSGILAVPLLASALSVYLPFQGGTGTSTIPSIGQVLVGQSNGTYAPVATSSLGITIDTSTFPTFTYASSTYYFASNPDGYIGSAGLSNYLTIATATSTYPSFTYASSTYVPYIGATQDLNLGVYEIDTSSVHANSSAGVTIHNSSGQDVALFGAGGGIGMTFYDGVILNAQTVDTIASFGSTKNLMSLATSTYPNLTELSYVKGVTSAVQTQLTMYQHSHMPLAHTYSFLLVPLCHTFHLHHQHFMYHTQVQPLV